MEHTLAAYYSYKDVCLYNMLVPLCAKINYLITASESFLLNFYSPFLGLGASVGFMGGENDSK